MIPATIPATITAQAEQSPAALAAHYANELKNQQIKASMDWIRTQPESSQSGLIQMLIEQERLMDWSKFAQMEELFKLKDLPQRAPREPLMIDYDPDWQDVIDLYSRNQYKFNRDYQFSVNYKQLTITHLVTNLRAELCLSRKDTIRACMEWATKTGYKFTQSKIESIVFDLELGSMMEKIAPGNEKLWHGERWVVERGTRNQRTESLSNAIQKMKSASGSNSWTVGEHHDLARRNLNKLEDGWKHCNHRSYWYQPLEDEGLLAAGISAKTYFSSCAPCGTVACPHCSFLETEKEVAQYSHEEAYGTRIPILVHVCGGLQDGPKRLKEMVRRWVKKSGAAEFLENTCGAYVATKNGYELQIMLPNDSSANWAVQELTRTWEEVGDRQVKVCERRGESWTNKNHIYTTEHNVPAAVLAFDLTLQSERALFDLVDGDLVAPELAWQWWLDWTGSKPGVRGMNRVWHGPGFRQFKIPDFRPTIEEDIVGDKSGDIQEPKYPRSHFNLESKEKKGQAVRIYSPYNGLGYVLECDLHLIPTDYKRWKPGDEKRQRQLKESNGAGLEPVNTAYNMIAKAPATATETERGTSAPHPEQVVPPCTPHAPETLSLPLVRYVRESELQEQKPIPASPSAWGVEVGTVRHLPGEPPTTKAEMRAHIKKYGTQNLGPRGIKVTKAVESFTVEIPAPATPPKQMIPTATPATHLFPEMQMTPPINLKEIERGQIEIRKSVTVEKVKSMQVGWSWGEFGNQ
jgi:hypothetical protein